MENQLISIIVPIYNVELFLKRCVDSLLNQTYTNLEIILVDDGSTDSSSKICDEYKKIDSRIVVVHKKNGGLSDARNAGLDIYNGDFVCFIDSDDWIEKTMITDLYKSIKDNNSNIAICRRFRAYDNKEKQLETYKTFPKNNCFSGTDGMKYLMSFCGYDMSVCDKMFSRYLFLNIRFPFGKTCEDSFIAYKVFSKANKVSYINKGLYNYYFRENSITRSKIVNETVIEANREQYAFIEKYHPEIKCAAASSFITAFISVFNEYIKRDLECNNINEFIIEARKYLYLALKNDSISIIKKIQIIIFCSSSSLYKKFFKLVGSKS